MSWVVEYLHRDGSVLSRVAMTGAVLRIGRALDNDLIIDDPHCAPYHGELRAGVDGRATLHDLGSRNGIVRLIGRRAQKLPEDGLEVQDEVPFRLGQSQIRIRHTGWALTPEQPLARAVWPWALAALLGVLLYTVWQEWLRDVNGTTPSYLYTLCGVAAALSAWSGCYALLGRLISGAERFFTHLLIASCGFLIVTGVDIVIEAIAFASGWLWPMRIERYVSTALVALIVRAHLRTADPRHWPVLRWAVGLVVALVMIVPVAQLWISSQRLTKVDTLSVIKHPALLLAKPVSVKSVTDSASMLKARADKARKKDKNDESDFGVD